MLRFMLRVLTLALVFAVVPNTGRSGEDTPKAAETRKLLQKKVSVDFADMTLSEAIDELKSQVKGLTFQLDTAGGVSKNVKMTYKGEDKTVAEVLDGMLKKSGYGYIIISKKGNAYDGIVKIKQGKERGYALAEEPGNSPGKTNDKRASEKDKPSAKSIAKAKATKSKEESADKPEPKPEDNADKAEREAKIKFNFAKTLAEDGKTARAKERLEELIAKYPNTKAAVDAKELLRKLKD